MDALRVDNKDKIFKGQQSQEKFICFFRHHWTTLAKDFVYFTIFMIVVVLTIREINTIQEILRGNRELKLLFVTAYLIGTIYMHRFFLHLLNYFVDIGIITNKRIIDHRKTVFFTDNIDSIDMAQIQNIERIEEGVLPSLMDYGDIKIYLNASDAVTTFRRVPSVKFHYRCISRQKEARQENIMQQRGFAGLKEIPREELFEILER